MLGSSTILALWILAASTGETTPASDCPGNIVTRASFQQAGTPKRRRRKRASAIGNVQTPAARPCL